MGPGETRVSETTYRFERMEGKNRRDEFNRLINDLRRLGVELEDDPEDYIGAILIAPGLFMYEHFDGVFYEYPPYSVLCREAKLEITHDSSGQSIKLHLYRFESNTFYLSPETTN